MIKMCIKKNNMLIFVKKMQLNFTLNQMENFDSFHIRAHPLPPNINVGLKSQTR